MLGTSLLVAPIFHESRVEFYLPAGTWTPFFPAPTSSPSHAHLGEKITGPKWVKFTSVPQDHVPVYVRENSVLVLGPEGVGKPDYEYCKVALEVRGYELREGGEVEVRVPTGKKGEIGAKVVVKREKGKKEELEVKVLEGKLLGAPKTSVW